MPHEHSTTTVSAKSSPRRSPPTLRRIERRSARDRLEARVRRFDASDAGFGVRPTESDRFAFDVEDFDVVRRVIHGESQPSVVGINRFDKRHLETEPKPPVAQTALDPCRLTDSEAFAI
jgi:hypothetical protein